MGNLLPANMDLDRPESSDFSRNNRSYDGNNNKSILSMNFGPGYQTITTARASGALEPSILPPPNRTRPSSTFLTLPLEIRLQVYEMVLRHDGPVKPIRMTFRTNGPHPNLSLLVTCTQIHDEATPVFYKVNSFGLMHDANPHPDHTLDTVLRVFKSPGPKLYLSFIKYMAIDWSNNIQHAQHLNLLTPDARRFLAGRSVLWTFEERLFFDICETISLLAQQCVGLTSLWILLPKYVLFKSVGELDKKWVYFAHAMQAVRGLEILTVENCWVDVNECVKMAKGMRVERLMMHWPTGTRVFTTQEFRNFQRTGWIFWPWAGLKMELPLKYDK